VGVVGGVGGGGGGGGWTASNHSKQKNKGNFRITNIADVQSKHNYIYYSYRW